MKNNPTATAAGNAQWGSDPIADLLRALEFDYIALTPGASFRGLHDSLVNHLGNTRPEILLCVHEEHAVSISHGYVKATGKLMPVALHSNVGLMHATMAIFNAWCDRVPILMIGAQGPVDAVQRRPWVDWIHTSRDLGSMIRGYIKWDDQPASVPAAIEAILRANQIALTEPRGPVYVCLDAGMQEILCEEPHTLPPVERFLPAIAGDPPQDAVDAVANLLSKAERPLLMIGRVSHDPQDWDRRVALAEHLGARVLTDLKNWAVFPTGHPLHPYPPGLFVSAEAGALVREADVIVSLDWIDLAGSLRQANGGTFPDVPVIQCSLDQYSHNGWSMDHQALPAVEMSILAPPDRLVAALVKTLGAKPAAKPAAAVPAPVPEPVAEDADGISVQSMARTTFDKLSDRNPSYIRLPLGWPGDCARFTHPMDYLGFDGGGGIGSGPGMAVGAALGLKNSDRLPVAILGDGDYLMGLTALWTGVSHKVPLLIVVANNHSFFNDELHQERVARQRGRPVENRSIGLRMGEPVIDLAELARGQGAEGLGPVTRIEDLGPTLDKAIDLAASGKLVVVDVHVVPEYSRAMSAALLRTIPNTAG